LNIANQDTDRDHSMMKILSKPKSIQYYTVSYSSVS